MGKKQNRKDGGEERFLKEVDDRLFKGVKVHMVDVARQSPSFGREVVVELSQGPGSVDVEVKSQDGWCHCRLGFSFQDGEVVAHVKQRRDWEQERPGLDVRIHGQNQIA